MIAADKAAFNTAFKYIIRDFAAEDPLKMSENSGAIFDPKQSIIRLKSLGQVFDIKYPEGNIVFNGSKYMPAWNWKWLILHYLARAGNAPIVNKLITYRELENGNLNYAALLRKSTIPWLNISHRNR